MAAADGQLPQLPTTLQDLQTIQPFGCNHTLALDSQVVNVCSRCQRMDQGFRCSKGCNYGLCSTCHRAELTLPPAKLRALRAADALERLRRLSPRGAGHSGLASWAQDAQCAEAHTWVVVHAIDYRKTATPVSCCDHARSMQAFAEACGATVVGALYDEECTRQRAIDTLEMAAERCQPGDTLFYFFAGRCVEHVGAVSLCFVTPGGQVEAASCLGGGALGDLVTGRTPSEVRFALVTDLRPPARGRAPALRRGSPQCVPELQRPCWRDREAVWVSAVGSGTLAPSLLEAAAELSRAAERSYSCSRLLRLARQKGPAGGGAGDFDIAYSRAAAETMRWPLVPRDGCGAQPPVAPAPGAAAPPPPPEAQEPGAAGGVAAEAQEPGGAGGVAAEAGPRPWIGGQEAVERAEPGSETLALSAYFQGAFLAGRPYAGRAYRRTLLCESGLEVLEHAATGLSVWAEALDLRRAAEPGAECAVLFHYTDDAGLAGAADRARPELELLAALADPEGAFGKGVYATSLEPESVDGHASSCTGARGARAHAMGSSALEHSPSGAPFCVPILVPSRYAHNIWGLRPLDPASDAAAGRGAGGERQRREGRDVWVIQLDQGGKERLAGAGWAPRVDLWRARLAQAEAAHGVMDPDALHCLEVVGSLFRAAGDLGEAERCHRVALSGRARLLGGRHPSVCSAAVSLARSLRAAGELDEAEVLSRCVLEDRRATLGPQSRLTLQAEAELAAALQDLRQEDEAAALYESAASGLRALFGDLHPDVWSIESRIAGLRAAAGQWEDAEAILRRVAEGRERRLGALHPGVLDAWSSLAALLEAAGRPEEAAGLHRRVLEGRQEALGPRHAHTLQTAAALAELRRAEGSEDAAEALYSRVLYGRVATLSPLDPAVQHALDALASFLVSRGRHGDARMAYLKVAEAKQRELGALHPSTLQSLDDLGLVLDGAGAYSEAEPLHRYVLQACEATLGRDHPETRRAVSRLAGVLRLLGRFREAEPLHVRALESSAEALGAEHPDSLRCASNLAALCQAMGKYAEAERLYMRALRGRRAALGDDHPEVLRTMVDLASAMQALGRRREAEGLLRGAVAQLQKTLGCADRETWAATDRLGEALLAAGEPEEAEVLYRTALGALAGPDQQLISEEARDCCVQLARAAHAAGRLEQAEVLQLSALCARRSALGPGHAKTLQSACHLAELQVALGRHGHAEATCRQALESAEGAAGPHHPDTLKVLAQLIPLVRGRGGPAAGRAAAGYQRRLAEGRGMWRSKAPDEPLAGDDEGHSARAVSL